MTHPLRALRAPSRGRRPRTGKAGSAAAARGYLRGGFTSTLLAACALPAQAHLVDTGLGPVYDGIAHFALTPEDFLPVLALAVLAGLRGAPAARRAIVALPLAWLAAALGTSLGAATQASAPAWTGVPAWLPLMLLGALLAIDLTLSARAVAFVAAALGLLLGAANGLAMAQAGPGMRGVIGVVAALFVASTLAAAAAVAWHGGWRRIAWRAAGSWLAASGLLLLGWSLR